MDKHLIIECLDLVLKEAELAILRKENIHYNNGYKMVVDKTIEMIRNNQNIVTILNQIKEYKKEGQTHPLSLFSEGLIDGSNEVMNIIYDNIDQDNYDE